MYVHLIYKQSKNPTPHNYVRKSCNAHGNQGVNQSKIPS